MDNFVVIAIVIAAVIVLGLVWHTYNRLVVLRNKLRSAWSDVDVQLSYRHNLVPNLVESVKGYASHERGVLESVAQARSAAMNAGSDIATRTVAEMALSGAVGNLFGVVERYPDLKASENFALLHEQLTTTENRIAFARQYYNETVCQYNTRIAEFSWNLIAGMLRYSPEKMFAAGAGDEAPQTRF